MKESGLIEKIIIGVILIGLTTALYLYTSGYRIRKVPGDPIDLEKTGMVSVKSIPEGASVYLDEELVTATNDSIAGISQGLHKLRIEKNGFVTWNKDIEVYEELVTDITAVLVSQSPRIEPLTNTGARNPSISPSLGQLAYFSKDTEEPGIWVIPLNDGLNIFRSNPTPAVQDTKFNKYSEGNSIKWSPDEKELLVDMGNGTHYIVNLATNTAETVTDLQRLENDWRMKLTQKRTDFIEKLDIPDEMVEIAKTDSSLWAPDEKKFLYTKQVGDKIEYHVYNLELPLPIGEKADTFVFETTLGETPPKITWYADSFHLVLTTGNIEQDKVGNISMIRIDGTNKTEIYNNTMHSDKVFSAPGGDKMIVLTTFKSGDQTDLYTVSIR